MFHKEGYKIIITSFIFSAIITILFENIITNYTLKVILQICALLFLIMILQFFRNPVRKRSEIYQTGHAEIVSKQPQVYERLRRHANSTALQ